MALFAASVGAVWIALTPVAPDAGGGQTATPSSAPGGEADADDDDDTPAALVPALRRTGLRPGIRRRSSVGGAPPPPAPIRRADDTMVVCSVLLHGAAAPVTGGAGLDPGIARISGDGEAVSVVWSGVRIEGREGQTRASCRAENQQVVSVVLDGEELLDGPQPY